MNGLIKNNGSTKKIRDQIEIWWLGGKIYKSLSIGNICPHTQIAKEFLISTNLYPIQADYVSDVSGILLMA